MSTSSKDGICRSIAVEAPHRQRSNVRNHAEELLWPLVKASDWRSFESQFDPFPRSMVVHRIKVKIRLCLRTDVSILCCINQQKSSPTANWAVVLVRPKHANIHEGEQAMPRTSQARIGPWNAEQTRWCGQGSCKSHALTRNSIRVALFS